MAEKSMAPEDGAQPSDGTDNGSGLPICFVIMPISDHPDYEAGHFGRVYKHLFAPACTAAGFRPIYPKPQGTMHIEQTILRQLWEADMVLCDTSSRNANVLFELGFRQAFDKPVALVKDSRSERLFDVSSLEAYAYSESMRIDQVENDTEKLATFIRQTFQSFSQPGNINSLIRLLQIRPATINELTEAAGDPQLQLVRADISDLHGLVQQLLHAVSPRVRPSTISTLNPTMHLIEPIQAVTLAQEMMENNTPDSAIIAAMQALLFQPRHIAIILTRAREFLAQKKTAASRASRYDDEGDVDPDDIPF